MSLYTHHQMIDSLQVYCNIRMDENKKNIRTYVLFRKRFETVLMNRFFIRTWQSPSNTKRVINRKIHC